MKILKKILIIAFVLQITEGVNAQTWANISSTRGSFNFQLPGNNFISKDTLGVLFYNYQVDTALTLDTHYIDDAVMIQNDALFTSLLNQNSGDSLRAVSGMMLLLTNGQLVSIQNLVATSSYPKGIEIGFTYKSDMSADGLIFSRIFYKNNKFTSFSINGAASDAVRIGLYKTTFFNSINFPQQ